MTYRGEIFGGQQPVRHGEINFGGLDSFLSRFFFYHDHPARCCRLIVVVLIVFQRRSENRRKISTCLTTTVRLLLKCFLLLRRRSSPTRGKRRRNRKRERKRTHQYSKSVFRSETIDDRESCLLFGRASSGPLISTTIFYNELSSLHEREI